MKIISESMASGETFVEGVADNYDDARAELEQCVLEARAEAEAMGTTVDCWFYIQD